LSYTKSTGWNTFTNNSTFAIDLRGKWLKSAMLRFRGRGEIVETERIEDSTQRDRTGSLNFRFFEETLETGSISTPGVPSGFTLREHKWRIGAWSDDEEETPSASVTLIHPRGSRSGGTSNIALGDSDDPSVIVNASTTNRASGDAYATITCQDVTVRYRIVAGTSYYKDEKTFTYTTDPMVTNTATGASRSHGGTLSDGSTSDEINIAGILENNTSNTIRVNVDGTNRVDIEYEIEWGNPPQVETGKSYNVGPESGGIKGKLKDDGNAETNCYVRYGRNEDNLNNEIYIGEFETGDEFTQWLSGLKTNTTYYYQIYATNEFGEGSGAIKSFETVATPPVIETGEVLEVGYFDAFLSGELIDTGGVECEVWFQWRETGNLWEVASKITTDDSKDIYKTIDGLKYHTPHEYMLVAENSVARVEGEVKSFRTHYPLIPAPEELQPRHGYPTRNLQPQFTFYLPEKPENPADKYHARIRFSKTHGMEPTAFVMETLDDRTNWQALINNSWVDFPLEGVDPNTFVRVTPTEELPFGPLYWDVAGHDGVRYGLDAQQRIDIAIPYTGEYGLYIASPEDPHIQEEWEAINTLTVTEASNGEIGSIEFEVFNETETLPRNLVNFAQSLCEEIGGFTIIGESGGWSVTDDKSYFGTYSIKYEQPTESPTENEIQSLEISVEPEAEYTASCYIYDPPDVAKFKIRADGNVIKETMIQPESGWQRVDITFTPGEENIKVCIEGLTDEEGQTFYVDGIQVERGSDVTAWRVGGRTKEVIARDIEYGSPVLLAVNDASGMEAEYQGWVREKSPSGETMSIYAIMTDGFMGERIAKEDYPTDADEKMIEAFSDAGSDKTNVETTFEHELEAGDKIQIIADRYNDVYEVDSVVDSNNFVIDVEYEEDEAEEPVLRPVEDIGKTVQRLISDYCAPIIADVYVDTETGYIAPIRAKNRTVSQVMENIRRQYDVYYFVDRLNQLHFGRVGDIESVEQPNLIIRGDV